MSKVLNTFLEFQSSHELSVYIAEPNVSLAMLRDEVGVDISRAVINLPQEAFPWLAHHTHWRQRTLPTGPANSRSYEGYVLAPTRDQSIFCLVLAEIEPSTGSGASTYFVRATQDWFDMLEKEFVSRKADLYCEVPNGFYQAPETTLTRLGQAVDPEFAARCKGMKPYYPAH